MKVIIDWRRADEVIGRTLDRYNEQGYPFNLPTVVTPQQEEHLPKGIKSDPEKFAYFLFCSCYFMSATDSVTAMKSLTKLYEAHPEAFDPVAVADISLELLTQWLQEAGLGFSEDLKVRHWKRNAKYLLRHHDGKILTLMNGVRTWKEADKRIRRTTTKGFFGFQHKMVSMLLYYLVAEKLIDEFLFPPPIDFHFLRFSLATEIVRVVNPPADGNIFKPAVLVALRRLYMGYSKRHQVSPIDLSNAVWLMAKALCRHNPGNKTLQGRYEARRTQLTAVQVTWTPSQRRGYERSCQVCPVRRFCKWDIGSGAYYRKGQIILRRRRQEMPDVELIEVHRLKTTPKPRIKRPVKRMKAESTPPLFDL